MSDNRGMNGKDFFIGAVVGGVIGAAAALLLAPKSGRETREDLSRGFESAKGVVREKSDQFAQRAGEVKETASDKWIEIRDTASNTIKEVASTVEDIKEAANRKWSEARSQDDHVEEIAEQTSEQQKS